MMDGASEPLEIEERVDIGPLSSSLGFLMRLAQLTVYEHFFAELSGHGLRPGGFSALLLIDRNPGIRQGVLAQKLKIKRAHMTKMIRGFEDCGYVTRNIPHNDRRSVELNLTDAGQAFVQKNFDDFFGYEERNNSRLTTAERAQLIGLLRKYLGLDTGEGQ